MHDYFSGNMQAQELNREVTVLANDGLIRVVRERGERRTGQPSVTTPTNWRSRPESYLALALSSLHEAHLEGWSDASTYERNEVTTP